MQNELSELEKKQLFSIVSLGWYFSSIPLFVLFISLLCPVVKKNKTKNGALHSLIVSWASLLVFTLKMQFYWVPLDGPKAPTKTKPRTASSPVKQEFIKGAKGL